MQLTDFPSLITTNAFILLVFMSTWGLIMSSCCRTWLHRLLSPLLNQTSSPYTETRQLLMCAFPKALAGVILWHKSKTSASGKGTADLIFVPRERPGVASNAGHWNRRGPRQRMNR